jgi:hypothetical protein
LRSFRRKYNIDVYTEGERLARGELTLEETAKTLKRSRETIRRLIAEKSLSAQQACKGAPWIIQPWTCSTHSIARWLVRGVISISAIPSMAGGVDITRNLI